MNMKYYSWLCVNTSYIIHKIEGMHYCCIKYKFCWSLSLMSVGQNIHKLHSHIHFLFKRQLPLELLMSYPKYYSCLSVSCQLKGGCAGIEVKSWKSNEKIIVKIEKKIVKIDFLHLYYIATLCLRVCLYVLYLLRNGCTNLTNFC